MRLSNIALAISAIYGGFSPGVLFAGGVNGVFFDISDLPTLFTTSSGTTPCPMPGQGSAVSVGLMLDKSQGSPLAVGAHRYWRYIVSVSTNQHHPRVSRIVLSTATTSTNIAVFQADNCADQGTIPALGATYAYDFGSPISIISASVYATFNGSRAALYQVEYSDDNTSWFSAFQGNMSATNCGLFAGSVFAYNGNHAIAINDSTARPELRARVNLLTYSEEFDNAVWTPTGVTVSTNTTVAPDGTLTADTITGDGAVSTHWLTQSNPALASGKTYSICAKAGTNNFIQLLFAGDANPWANFDLSAGAVGSTGTNVTATISSLGNGWYRCTISTPSSSASSIFVNLVNSASAPRAQSSALSTSVYLWAADIRPANIGAAVPAYQRIADANTYDTNGFPLYLLFDGIDDGMYTPANLNLSATDKVGVFAGVRKLSDAATGVVYELSGASTSFNGSFALVNKVISANDYWFNSRGTLDRGASSNIAVSPITNVLTGIGDIGGDQSTLRINGVQAAINTGDQGTGNYGTYPLYIGSRNNSSLWLNGHLHGLIVVGSAVSAGNISATESWMAQKMGIVIP